MQPFLILLLFFTYSKAEDIKKELFILYKPCDRNDLELDLCLKNLTQNFIQQNINGSAILKFPTLDPWLLPKTKNVYTTSGIRITLITENVKIYGLKRTTMVDIKTKFLNSNHILTIESMIHLPKIQISGNYLGNIRVTDLNIRPKGMFNMTLINIINNIKLTGTLENTNNQIYLKLKNFVLDPLIEDIRFNITGVFPAEPQLDAIFVQFIDSYWRNLYSVVIRETRGNWEPMLLNATNEILNTIPFDNIIKNSELMSINS